MAIKKFVTLEDMVDQGKLVIRKAIGELRIKQYKKSTKPGTSGTCGYGWCKYMIFMKKTDLEATWKLLLSKGAIEG